MAENEQLIPLEDGPWDGLVDAKAPTARRVGKYLAGYNMYPTRSAIGDHMMGRRGFKPLIPAAIPGYYAQALEYLAPDLGTGSVVKQIYEVKGGQIYKIPGDMVSAAVLMVTTANLTTAGIVLSALLRVAVTAFSGKLHFSDGVNVPFLWDGTAGAAGLTALVNSPALYGQPIVKDARIVGILASDRTTLVWSEVQDATTGYTSGGFTNAIHLRQTDPGPIYQIIATETEILVQRARSTTYLAGGLTASYETSVNREGISRSSGTISPFCLAWVETDLYTVDATYRPHLLRSGAVEYESLGDAFAEEFRTFSLYPESPYTEQISAIYYEDAGLVLFGPYFDVADPATVMTGDPRDSAATMLVYDVSGPSPVAIGVWRGFTNARLKCQAICNVANPVLRLLHADNAGGVYLHGVASDDEQANGMAQVLADTSIAGTATTIDHILETQPLGDSTAREKIFDRLALTFRKLAQSYDVDVSVVTPSGVGGVQTITVPAATMSTLVPGTGTPTVDSGEEYHTDIGLDERGRWARVRLYHHQTTSRFAPVSLMLFGYTASDDPEIA